MNTPVYYCCVPGCWSSTNAKLMKFPSDDFLRTSYLQAIGRSDLNYVENVREHYFICSEHFDGSPHGLDEVERIENIYQCSSCHIMLNSLDEVQSHVNACTAISDEQCIEPRSPPSSGGIERKGTDVDAYLPAAKQMKSAKSYECLQCKKTFGHVSTLNNHMKLHMNEKPFVCHMCSKGFVSNGRLNTHLKKFHNDQKYRCPVSGCTKEYKAEHYLKVHVLSHDNQLNFHCEVCTMKFIDKHSLKVHLRSHSGEKPFQCLVCQRRFAQTSHLRTHERIHNNVKPFVCGVCGSGFRQTGNLKKHVEAYHS